VCARTFGVFGISANIARTLWVLGEGMVYLADSWHGSQCSQCVVDWLKSVIAAAADAVRYIRENQLTTDWRRVMSLMRPKLAARPQNISASCSRQSWDLLLLCPVICYCAYCRPTANRLTKSPVRYSRQLLL